MQFTRESIFVSGARSFCSAFAVVIGVSAAAFVVFIGLMMLSKPEMTPPSSEVTIAADASGSRALLPPSAPAVLMLDITGVIGEGTLTTEKMKDILLDSREGMLSGGRVKAILLHMNTPGGTVIDSDGIYRLLKEYKEKYNTPIYAYVDGLCASGGMYISSAADKIYATEPSVIGSVGVILGPTFNFYDAMGKIGVKANTITQGKDKDMLNPFRPWAPGEEASLVNITKSLYENFVDIVTSARKNLNKQNLIDTLGAQVFVAKTAENFGYIDVASASYEMALKELCAAAHIEENEKYQVVRLTTPHSLLSELIQGKLSLLQGKITHEVKIGPLSPALSGQFLYLYQPNASL